MEDGGLVVSKGGKVRLKPRSEFDGDWDPLDEDELTLWSCVHRVARALEKNGVEGAGAIVAKLGAGRSEEVRALSYRLYALAEKRKWNDEALGYNALVTEWPAIQENAARVVSQSRLGI
jgi:putative DNA methylase